MSQKPLVAVVMGSKSDAGLMQDCLDTLDGLGIPYESAVMSAHRQPEKVREFAQSAHDRGIEVIIAAAGLAAHLPGVVAAWTPLPVIGVPVPAGELRGIDALYSMAQMPAGTPVACVAIGSHGARNAAHLAARILALKHESVRKALEDYRQKMASE
jgi:5-(carboxyamino)imidazole ribonucleotide mutase